MFLTMSRHAFLVVLCLSVCSLLLHEVEWNMIFKTLFRVVDRPSMGDSDTRQGKFALDRDTGFITLAEKLERATPNTNMSITATDDGSCCQSSGTSHQTIGYVEVRIIGVNHPPQFDACPPSFTPTVKENMEAGTHVFNVSLNYHWREPRVLFLLFKFFGVFLYHHLASNLWSAVAQR